MLPEGLAAAAAAAFLFLQIHMGACSAPSPGTWPVIVQVHQNSEGKVSQQFGQQRDEPFS